ncbi:hypothetical protein JTB14_035676 [Gonioctena quinquepunctata]|nr:hypothetical protein JTB14_035676 [Gonioctena quinquepunctata]
MKNLTKPTEELKCSELIIPNWKKNHIVSLGIQTDKNDNLAEIDTETLIKDLEVDIKLDDVDNAYKLGKSATSPIVIEFISFFKKLKIFQTETKLRAQWKLNFHN